MPTGVRGLFSEKKAPYGLFVVSLAAHISLFLYLMFLYGPCVSFLSADCSTSNNDTQHYVIIADNISHGNGYSRFAEPPYEPDALRTPLLPFYFAPFTYFGGLNLIWLAMGLLNILLSLLSVVVYRLARLFLPHGYALVAGIVFALEPLYLYRSQLAEPDALLVLLITCAAYFLVRSWKERTTSDLAICAALLGMSILAKPTAQYLAAVFVVFEVLHLAFVARSARRERITRIILLFAVIVLIVFPWLARNKSAFGVAELSSIQGYNLYEYYTKAFPIEGDSIPVELYAWSREPSRFLPLQATFIRISIERIKQHPIEFSRAMAVGAIRNLFVSDISAIYYYGHAKVLPFPYHPETKANIHERLLAGDLLGALKGLGVLPKLLWVFSLGVMYWFAAAGCLMAYRKDGHVFAAFTMFAVLFLYLVVSSGLYVDAKYRLPALPLVVIVALYGMHSMLTLWNALRRKVK